MSAPAIVIRLELEAAPRIYADVLYEGDSDRLSLWLASMPRYADLFDEACRLAEEARAP